MTGVHGARAMVRALVDEQRPEDALDLLCDREHLETTHHWLIPVNSVRYYMTALARHDLGEEWIVAVPKDGGPASRPFVTGTPIEQQLHRLGSEEAIVLDDRLGRRPPARLGDDRLLASQPAAVYRDWFRQLRWFRVRLRRGTELEPDALMLTIAVGDEQDEAHKRAIVQAPGLTGTVYWSRTRGAADLVITSTGGPFSLTGADLLVALAVERRIVEAGLADAVMERPPWHATPEAVTAERYPELF